jgi:hypothetical protein
MRTFPKIALAAAAAWLAAAAALSAQPSDPSALVPCAFALSEIAEAMGVELQHGDLADMTTPVGRDVGCLYSSKATDFVFGVRQTWDKTRPPGKPPARAMPGHRAIPGDPNGAVYVTDTGNGSSGELVYVRGKVQTRVFWHGGNLTDADGLQRLLHLRRVP